MIITREFCIYLIHDLRMINGNFVQEVLQEACVICNAIRINERHKAYDEFQEKFRCEIDYAELKCKIGFLDSFFFFFFF